MGAMLFSKPAAPTGRSHACLSIPCSGFSRDLFVRRRDDARNAHHRSHSRGARSRKVRRTRDIVATCRAVASIRRGRSPAGGHRG
jgi:hypothetical protein